LEHGILIFIDFYSNLKKISLKRAYNVLNVTNL